MNNYVLVSVVGKNVLNYVKWLIKNKINIVKLNIVKYNELYIVIDYRDYDTLTKYSKTYEIKIIKKYGRLRLIDTIKKNIVIISCLILAIFFICYMSTFIFSVDIVYNDKVIVANLKKELSNYGIKKYSHKKSYAELTKIKDSILASNKDTLEWLEIEVSGTKYVVKLVERKKEIPVKGYKYQSVVSKKDATITNIKGYAGEKVKTVGEYVKSGDVIISGIITKPDGTLVYTKASGIVMGEVWYQVQVEYPLYYQEEKLTGKSKQVIAFSFLSKEIPIFPYKKYKHFNKASKVILNNNLLPFRLVTEKLYEVDIVEEIYTNEEAIIKAKELAIKRLKDSNQAIVSIKDTKILAKEIKKGKIELDLFISAIEDITEVLEIEEVVEN